MPTPASNCWAACCSSQAQFNPNLIENLFDAREVVGTELARKAALRHAPEDLENLRDVLVHLKEAGEISEVQDLELQFFYGLAEASKNIFYVFMINSIKPVYVEFRELYAATAREPVKVLRLQRAVVSAIEKGDEKLAARKMLLSTSNTARTRFIVNSACGPEHIVFCE